MSQVIKKSFHGYMAADGGSTGGASCVYLGIGKLKALFLPDLVRKSHNQLMDILASCACHTKVSNLQIILQFSAIFSNCTVQSD